MAFKKGNKEHEKRTKKGRDGYGLEVQKKRVLEQAFHTTKKAMLKDATDLKEKEKIDLASKIVLKEIGKNVELKIGGDKDNPVLVKFINEKPDNN